MTEKTQFKVRALLKMAELSDDRIKRNEYLNNAESLLFDVPVDCEPSLSYVIPSRYEHLIKFYEEHKKGLWWKTTDHNYNLYLEFCKSNGIQPLYVGTFVRMLRKIYPCFETKQSWIERDGRMVNQKVWIPYQED